MSFLKWYGGKGGIMSNLIKYFPDMKDIKGYIEPFLGAGSVFFFMSKNGYLEGKKVYLSDINAELINCYVMIRDRFGELTKILDVLQEEHSIEGEDFYYKIRDSYFSSDLKDVEKAACYIYMNKAGFNGMMRMNSKGKFNMTCGHPGKTKIYDMSELKECSNMLRKRNVRIDCMSYEDVLKINNGQLKDYFCYNDPPYDDIRNERSALRNFRGYNGEGFDKRDYLKDVFKGLSDVGCKIMISNVGSPMILSEFKDYFINDIKAKRMCAGNPEYRGEVDEVVITNYEVKLKRQKSLMDY